MWTNWGQLEVSRADPTCLCVCAVSQTQHIVVINRMALKKVFESFFFRLLRHSVNRSFALFVSYKLTICF